MISVVTPAFQEGTLAPATQALWTKTPTAFEWIIVDTSPAPLLSSHPWPKSIRYRHQPEWPSRSKATLAGIKMARGDIVCILHVDVSPPECFIQEIQKASEHGFGFGAFQKRYSGHHPLMRVQAKALSLLNQRRRALVGTNALFFPRSWALARQELWGTDFLEDVVLADALSKEPSFTIRQSRVLASSRRYARNGPWKQVLLNAGIYAAFRMGAKASTLEHWYRTK